MKQCGSCDTVWKDEWLHIRQHPDECPMCYTDWDGTKPPSSRVMKRKEFVDMRLELRLNDLEAELKELELRTPQLECIPLTELSVVEQKLKAAENQKCIAANKNRVVQLIGMITDIRKILKK